MGTHARQEWEEVAHRGAADHSANGMPDRTLQKLLRKWGHTPLHPQWFALRQEPKSLSAIGPRLHGLVLDIGCAEQKVVPFLPGGSRYIGLDYSFTAKNWYGTRPHVYGDAQALPFPSQSIDGVLLLDVLEHLPDPERAVSEIHRVLKPGGQLILHVPFMYPIHDAPLDFRRWTSHGLRHLVHTHHFVVEEEVALGRSLETAALVTNIAVTNSILRCLRRRHPAAIAIVLLPLFVLVTNSLAWALSRIVPEDTMMPSGYRFVCLRE